jgi:4-aminobutyrate aminotransferase-like enzyme
LATLTVLDEEALCERSRALGATLLDLLEPLRHRHGVTDIRGLGLLVGIEVSSTRQSLACMRALLERGYITVPAAVDARVISLTPPLCVTLEQLTGFVAALTESLMVTV